MRSRVSPVSSAVAPPSAKVTDAPPGIGTGVVCAELCVEDGVALGVCDPVALPVADPVALPVGLALAEAVGLALGVALAEALPVAEPLADPAGPGESATVGATSVRAETSLSSVPASFTTTNSSGALAPVAYRPPSG